jgi:hypothetical protein
MSLPDGLEEALSRPVGARVRRCALQVNPYPYLQRGGGTGDHGDADAYNAAVVDALLEEHIELIGLTNHDRSGDAGLRPAAEAQDRISQASPACFPDSIQFTMGAATYYSGLASVNVLASVNSPS